MMIVKKVFFLYPLYHFIHIAPSLEVTLLKYSQAVNLIFFTHDSHSLVKMQFMWFFYCIHPPNRCFFGHFAQN